MTAKPEGFIGDILDKFKDLITDDDKKPEDPPLTPDKCCGPMPPVVGPHLVGAPAQHKPDCPNHPDNLPEREVAS